MPPSAIEPAIPPETIKTKPAVPNGTATSAPSSFAPRSTPYTVLEQPSRTGRKLRVIVIGAGASALNFAHDVDTSASLDVDLVCYEKNPEIGGTWFENKYPGCACDIPSVLYQYSWAPSAEWSSYYSRAPEILAYFKKVAEDYGLLKYVRLSHTVVGAAWDEEEQQWRVRVQRGADADDVIEDKAHVLINASGVLNKWKWPAIKGRETFKGPMLHSAAWDDRIDLAGKRVAVIGGGSSAVQIVPNIQPAVKSLSCFIRSTSWVTAGFGQRYAGKDGANFNYTEEQKEVLRKDPKKYLTYRKTIESELNSRFKFIINGSKEQADARAFAEKEMRRKLSAKPEIADMIVPTNFAVGCRRPTPGNGYLEALCEDNVTVVSQSIQAITEKGILTDDGVEHEFDIIVCATGFDVSWRPKYPTIGRGGRSLSEEWKDIPNTYLSISVPHFPNYLIFNGPFGPYGHGSFLPITEVLSRHFIQMLEKMSIEYLTSFAPTEAAVADFAEHRRVFLPRTAWTSPCRSWFKQGTVDGEVMMWPGSRTHFFESMKAPRWEDYELKYADRNRFYYLGNGFAAREVDGRDITWYLGLLDCGDVQPKFSDDDIRIFMAQ
ncbi:putative sterigmatocystin biosynthesis monooxygenase stcW [Lasiodiplodia hormozganensis]|uniref:Sterigmatocystin biosynthesis monooxygenase stcW n=1 Tax=Lasiodiplodia hormozganensis TaxID=869390 RepID=A0AA40CMN5_9PEZI|nr:putative sterigmatocystin biosynthesis monooxygenase stcW [Lasiodiplodia hormozganensis]